MEYIWVEEKDLPEKIKEKFKGRFISSARKKDGKYIIETSMPEVYVDFRKVWIFNENGEEEYNIYDTKMEARIEGEKYIMVDDSVEKLLKRLVKALDQYY
jgi:hypothetical protein